MSHSASIATWVGINIALGVFGPLLVGQVFIRYAVAKPRITLRQFYSRGELGLVSLLIALSVIVEVQKGSYTGGLRNWVISGLVIFGVAAAIVWAVPLCEDLAHIKVNWNQVWKESWQVSLMVFSIALVAEILLELAS